MPAVFRAVKHVRMLLIMFLKSKFIFFLELINFLRFCTKNKGTCIIRNGIEENVLVYRVVRVIPAISANEEKEPNFV